MDDMAGEAPGRRRYHPPRYKRGDPAATAVVVLTVLVGMLIVVTVASLITVVNDSHKATVPLYDVPADGGSSFTVINSLTANLEVTVCTEDALPHVSMMANEWQGTVRAPGVVRIFTAAPGCHDYVFTDIALPAEAIGASPCAEWAITGVIVSADRSRPSEAFITPAQCIGGSPQFTPCNPGEC